MTPWLIAPLAILVLLLLGIGLGVLLRYRRRQFNTIDPVTLKWRDEHAYPKDGDRGK